MFLARNPWSCLIEHDCDLIVHTRILTQYKKVCACFKVCSESLTHTHLHTRSFYDSFSRASVARFPHETHMDFQKISGTNRDDRRLCSWPSFSYSHDQDGMLAQKQTVESFICLDKIIRRVLFIDTQIEQLDLNVKAY